MCLGERLYVFSMLLCFVCASACMHIFAEEGHVLLMLPKVSPVADCASFRTQFISTSGKCLLMHYWWLHKGFLQIIMFNEDKESEIIRTVMSNQSQPNSWNMLLIALPDRKQVQQIFVRGFRIPGQVSGLAIDDLIIRPCADFRKLILTSL